MVRSSFLPRGHFFLVTVADNGFQPQAVNRFGKLAVLVLVGRNERLGVQPSTALLAQPTTKTVPTHFTPTTARPRYTA